MNDTAWRNSTQPALPLRRGGMEVGQVKRLKELEKENHRLKQKYIMYFILKINKIRCRRLIGARKQIDGDACAAGTASRKNRDFESASGGVSRTSAGEYGNHPKINVHSQVFT